MNAPDPSFGRAGIGQPNQRGWDSLKNCWPGSGVRSTETLPPRRTGMFVTVIQLPSVGDFAHAGIRFVQVWGHERVTRDFVYSIVIGGITGTGGPCQRHVVVASPKAGAGFPAESPM